MLLNKWFLLAAPLLRSNLKLQTPYPVKRDADALHFTYLDTVGRPVITLHKDNLVENHIQDFTVSGTMQFFHFSAIWTCDGKLNFDSFSNFYFIFFTRAISSNQF